MPQTFSFLLLLLMFVGCSQSSEQETVEPSAVSESQPIEQLARQQLPEEPAESGSFLSVTEMIKSNAGKFIDWSANKATRIFLQQNHIDPTNPDVRIIAEIHARLDEQLKYVHWLMLRECLVEAFELRSEVIQANTEKPLSPELSKAFRQVLVIDALAAKKICLLLVTSEKERIASRKKWKEFAFSTEKITLLDLFETYKQGETIQSTIRLLEQHHSRLETTIELYHRERHTTLRLERHPYWSKADFTKYPPYAGLLKQIFLNLDRAGIGYQMQLLRHLYPVTHREHFATLMCALVGYEIRKDEAKRLGLSRVDMKRVQKFLDDYFEKIGGRPARKAAPLKPDFSSLSSIESPEHGNVESILGNSVTLPFCHKEALRITNAWDSGSLPALRAKEEMPLAAIQHRLLFGLVSADSPAHKWSTDSYSENSILLFIRTDNEIETMGPIAQYLDRIGTYNWLHFPGNVYSYYGSSDNMGWTTSYAVDAIPLRDPSPVPVGKLYFELLQYRFIQLAPPLTAAKYNHKCDEDVTFLLNWVTNKGR